ncbi:sulfatase-like hydrolase/transferase [Variovorax sp. PCZ-1]|uniref:sulfatase-like hydrolase/transferase n=1 Tax=Variovorax sp. PCZ-1 TaxID=2835533 RepID=UPI001BCC572F|nr:sulfatase-like hydrolase/transferase [Variovorax sp. PCZ-1]MBS7807288.1 sulfatase-like hydrolase/transferase [Variovorax sp. PCZ-1]
MSTQRTNTLILLTDEQDAQALSCAGHPFVKTPHMDALAARGTRFTNAFTPSPICVPARASLATGRWVHNIGYWDNAMGYDGRVPGWGHALIDAGQRVASIGKLHYVNDTAPTGFTEQHDPLHLAEGVGQVWGSVRNPLPEQPRPSRLFDQLGSGESSYNRYDVASATQAAQWLRERGSETDAPPWTLFVGFVAPHFPLVVPQKYIDQIDIARIPVPRLHPDSGVPRHPWVQRHADFSNADAELGAPERRRYALACYYALVNFIDEQIGHVLQALAATGQQETTRVILSSDHGDNQGVRGMWNKSTLYREATNIPMIIAGPGVPEGVVRTTNVNLIDIAPTVLDTAGLTPDASLPGESLIALAQKPDDPQRIGFSEYHAVGSPSAAYMLRQGDWAYHYYVGYEPELFDLRSDPGQTTNIAQQSQHATALALFEAKLRQLLDPEGIDKTAKADQDQLIARFGGRDAALKIGAPGASPVPAARGN